MAKYDEVLNNSAVLQRAVRRQKFLGLVALVGLFLCGLFIGVSLVGEKRHVQYTKNQCERIQDKITEAIRNSDVKKMEQLQGVYSMYCLKYMEITKPVNVDEKKELSTCEKIEELLMGNLSDEKSLDVWSHENNVKIYEELMRNGCPENKEKFSKLKQAELDIAESLKKFDSDYFMDSGDAQPVDEKKELSTCEKIEELLIGKLSDEKSLDVWSHENNVKIYEELMRNGCPENKEKFSKLKQTELDIAESLKKFDSDYFMDSGDAQPCEIIERNLKNNLGTCDVCSYYVYLQNAKIYSSMAENGCPENSDKYKELALGQLKVASALMDKNDMEQEENIESVIDTYKKLQMQNKAYEYLDKVRKLVGPASDFILTMEKVINE